MKDCSDVIVWLRRDLDGAAEPSAEAAAHLERCDGCKAEAGRLKAIAEASRAALPEAAVPIDFTDQVMHTLTGRMAEHEFVDAMRPRWMQRLLFVFAVAALVVVAVWIWPARRGPGEKGRLLDTGASGRIGELAYTTLSPSRIDADGRFAGGTVLLRSDSRANFRTPLADVSMSALTDCVIRITKSKEIEEMKLSELKTMVPAFLAVTVLTGSCRVANAQGEVEVEKEKIAEVRAGEEPRINTKALMAELERIQVLVQNLNKRVDEVTALMRRLDLDAFEKERNAVVVARDATKHAVRLKRIESVIADAEESEERLRLDRDVKDCADLLRSVFDKPDPDAAAKLEARLQKLEKRAQALTPVRPASGTLSNLLQAERDRNDKLMAEIEELRRAVASRRVDAKREEQVRYLIDENRMAIEETRKKLYADPESALLQERLRELNREHARLSLELDRVSDTPFVAGGKGGVVFRPSKEPLRMLVIEYHMDRNRMRLAEAERMLAADPDSKEGLAARDTCRANLDRLEGDLAELHRMMESLEELREKRAKVEKIGKRTEPFDRKIASLEAFLENPEGIMRSKKKDLKDKK